MDHVERCLHSEDELMKMAKRLRLEHQFRNLYNVKTVDDFKYWAGNQYLGGSIKSMPVQSTPPASLDGLFG